MRKFLAAAFIFVFFTISVQPVFAIENAPAGKEDPAQILNQMGPAMGNMMEMMMAGLVNFLAKPDTADKLASFSRNYYEALIKKGFSKEEALTIVSSHQPMKSMMGK